VVYVFDAPQIPVADLHKGIITEDKAKQLLEALNLKDADEFFICGPGPMMENVKNSLEKAQIKKEKIHIEYFTAVIEAVNTASGQSAGKDLKAKVKVLQYGIETEFDLETGGISILDAAIEAGVDAPFSCKGAVCCTCRAKVLEGKVKMDANFALTDDEVAQGYVLTCQSHPITENVVIDYDAV
jgi:ring-1,2-phenylacetyl-CoA epoxidase subunit PaaE